ncbi:hypothetical protein LUL08_000836 [Escherichia coli]|nr:hypothetical protein [Escherichia coli]EJH1294984.1 hypothetical protein [Escherichia coli]EJH1410759.1 hypothetical protein [Escherichia coli]EJH1619717.1 hypothetical protein [Escherichia coli]
MSASKYARRADSAHDKIYSERLSVSFEFLDLSLPEFFIHGLNEEHYRKFFDCLNALANATEAQIVQQTHPSLIPKSIFNKGGTYLSFPDSLIDLIAVKIRAPKRAPDPEDTEAIKIDAAELQDAKSQASEVIRRAFEVRIAKSFGRLHGFVWNKVFYLVWIDPAHNLYPNDTGIRLHKNYATVKGFGPDEIRGVLDTNKSLVEECNQLKADIDSLLL